MKKLLVVEVRQNKSSRYEHVMNVNPENDEQFKKFQMYMIQANYYGLDVRVKFTEKI
jgi:hypothetical protein